MEFLSYGSQRIIAKNIGPTKEKNVDRWRSSLVDNARYLYT